MTISSYALIVYTIMYKPFMLDHMNKVDIFNEAVVLLLCYIAWSSFSSFNENNEAKFELGWVYCFILFFMLAFNVGVLLKLSLFNPLREKFRKWMGKNKSQNH